VNNLYPGEGPVAREVHWPQVIMKTHRANTYDLIVAAESEDKGRSAIETLIYVIFIVSAVVSIISAAAQPVVTPSRVAVKECNAPYCA
jgi:hypothetical protein